MSAHRFLSEFEGCYVRPNESDALDGAVQIPADAPPSILVQVARGRLLRLSEHLELITTLAADTESDAAKVAEFLHPLLDEVVNLLGAAEVHLNRQATLAREADHAG